jgi:hypothetical protein
LHLSCLQPLDADHHDGAVKYYGERELNSHAMAKKVPLLLLATPAGNFGIYRVSTPAQCENKRAIEQSPRSVGENFLKPRRSRPHSAGTDFTDRDHSRWNPASRLRIECNLIKNSKPILFDFPYFNKGREARKTPFAQLGLIGFTLLVRE